MPLTQQQNREEYIVRSLMSYLKTNVVTPYNAEVASSTYPTALGIELSFPDDPEKSPDVPVIIIGQPIDVRSADSTGIGDGTVFQHKQFRFTCFPAVTTENKPSQSAAAVLRNYMNWALGTGLYIPLYDYSTNPATQSESAQIEVARIINSPASFAPLLAIEKNRFDYLLQIKIPVATING